MNLLERKAIGCLSGAAVGDSLGGSTEGYSPEQIKERFGGYVTGIESPFNQDWKNARPVSPFHKGDGHITDDTLMTEALIHVYERFGTHLDAYKFADGIIPELIEKMRWIPELERDSLLIHRIFHAEKWLIIKLHHGHVDPREAGVGNIVNCGATMYMSPVGIVNSGNPEGAYKEAIEIAGAHQSSFGREAAGVFAAAVATAMSPDATYIDVIDVARNIANDGTKAAIIAVTNAAKSIDNWKDAIPALRAAVSPFDSVGEAYREPSLDSKRPSRTKSIEELPIALGFLAVTKGAFEAGILGAINYGRDSDSIATMFGSISGALNGREAIPASWIETIEKASRIDLVKNGQTLAGIAKKIAQLDLENYQRHRIKVQELIGE